MNAIYILESEVPGGLGPRTEMDRSTHPPNVSRLHFVFEGWLGDSLIESFPCYLVTAALAESFRKEGVSGFELDEADIEMSEQFREFYPTRELPVFKWLKVTGREGESDLFMTKDHRLGVTQKVLDLVSATDHRGLTYCKVE